MPNRPTYLISGASFITSHMGLLSTPSHEKICIFTNITWNSLKIIQKILKQLSEYHKKILNISIDPLNISFFCFKNKSILNQALRPKYFRYIFQGGNHWDGLFLPWNEYCFKVITKKNPRLLQNKNTNISKKYP